jgi:hypothetical protein
VADPPVDSELVYASEEVAVLDGGVELSVRAEEEVVEFSVFVIVEAPLDEPASVGEVVIVSVALPATVTEPWVDTESVLIVPVEDGEPLEDTVDPDATTVVERFVVSLPLAVMAPTLEVYMVVPGRMVVMVRVIPDEMVAIVKVWGGIVWAIGPPPGEPGTLLLVAMMELPANIELTDELSDTCDDLLESFS